jgi:hypothetical protein
MFYARIGAKIAVRITQLSHNMSSNSKEIWFKKWNQSTTIDNNNNIIINCEIENTFDPSNHSLGETRKEDFFVGTQLKLLVKRVWKPTQRLRVKESQSWHRKRSLTMARAKASLISSTIAHVILTLITINYHYYSLYYDSKVKQPLLPSIPYHWSGESFLLHK